MLTSIKVKYVQSNWFERALRSTNLRMNFIVWPCWRCNSAYYRLQFVFTISTNIENASSVVCTCVWRCSLGKNTSFALLVVFKKPMNSWEFFHFSTKIYPFIASHLTVRHRNLQHVPGTSVVCFDEISRKGLQGRGLGVQGGELKRSCCHNSRWGISVPKGFPGLKRGDLWDCS